MRPRASRAQLLAFLLCFILGFSAWTQIQQTKSQPLSSLRQSELVSLLDSITVRNSQLAAQAQQLRDQNHQLQTGTDQGAQAEKAATSQLETLSILTGRAPATGPGLDISVIGPPGSVTSAMLLDALQELRDAGAEAVQIGSVRVVAGTSFVDADSPNGAPVGVKVDRTLVTTPLHILVIGNPQTMETALNIPGGVIDYFKTQSGATVIPQIKSSLVISATVP